MLNLTVHATPDLDGHRAAGDGRHGRRRGGVGIVTRLRRRPRRRAPDAHRRLLPGPPDVRPRDHPDARSSATSSAPAREFFGIRIDADRHRRRHRHHAAGRRRRGSSGRRRCRCEERAFVDRARVIGAGSGHIMRRHILPNVMNLIVANAVLDVRRRDPDRDDALVHRPRRPVPAVVGPAARRRARRSGAPGLGAWWYFVPPGVCIVLVVFAFTLVGNALDDILNPRRERMSAIPPSAQGPARLDRERDRRDVERRRGVGSGARAPEQPGAHGRCPSRPTRTPRCSRSRT